jgi:hypothetical protein
VRQEEGDYAGSLAAGDEAINAFRRCGDARWLSQALIDTGTSAFLQGQAERASVLREEGFALCRAAGNWVGLAQAINDVGVEAAQRGESARALASFRDSLAMMIDADEKVYIAHPLASMASLLVAGGQEAIAARLLGAVAQAHETNRTFPWNTERARDEQTTEHARIALGEARFSVEFAVGRRLSVLEAANEALRAANQL